jgi:diacylglycerol kinase (CTP)
MRASFPSPPPMSLSSFSPAPLDGGLRQRTAPAAAAANGSAHTSTNGSAAPNGHGTPARGADKPATRAPAAAAAAAAERIDWEIPRKTLHASIGAPPRARRVLHAKCSRRPRAGFFSVWLWARDGSPRRVLVALSGALAVIVPADVLRLRYRPFARVYERVLGFLMRDSEKVCGMCGVCLVGCAERAADVVERRDLVPPRRNICARPVPPW